MANRNPIKQWEVTFPQCGDVTKQEFIDSFPPADYIICATEEHENGGLHHHLGIKLKKGISHSKLVKYLEAKWPEDWKRIHISAIKQWENFNDYCKKEDPNPIIIGGIEKHKPKHILELEETIRQGEASREYSRWKKINELEKENLHKFLDYESEYNLYKMNLNKVDLDEFIYGPGIRERLLEEKWKELMINMSS